MESKLFATSSSEHAHIPPPSKSQPQSIIKAYNKLNIDRKKKLTLSSFGLSSSHSLLFSTVMALSRSLPCSAIFLSLSFSCFTCFCLSLLNRSRSLNSSSSRKRWRFRNSALISLSRASKLVWKIGAWTTFYFLLDHFFLGIIAIFVLWKWNNKVSL